MGSFGERLRREREMRGISLDEIATATKISARNLRALEDEKFNQLPGGVFNRGFVRAYAKFLGIDEDQIVAEYIAASQETEAARELKLKTELAKQEVRKSKDAQEITLEPKSQWGTIAVIVLIAVVAYGGYTIYQKKKAERAQHSAVQPVAPARAAVPQATSPNPAPATNVQPRVPDTTAPTQQEIVPATPTATTTAAQKAPALSTTPETPKPAGTSTTSPVETGVLSPINLTMKVKEETWVEVKADGKTLVSGTLSPGTERSFKANEKMEVKLGKAAGVELSYNGKPVPNPNNIQDVRKITFTPSGYE